MIDPQRARVDAAFDEALALPARERPRFLDGLAGDVELRAEVEALLRLSATPAPSLEPGALAASLLAAVRDLDALASSGGELATGQRVGAWRVVRELARGGMGTVYVAERADGHFAQAGALKLGRAAAHSDEVARRLRRERRILASLTHANIATLLDGGQLEDGRPFFVMELVEGRAIDRYCDEKQLTIEQRLDLFVRVCAGVQHAHRQLVVHRDVKPSNIIVTADGDVKLLDFGIARLLSPDDPDGEEAVTTPVTRIMTPEYASPEQVRGEPVATASDVYQLGLLLYELLTGERAQTMGGWSPGALEQAVCETVPIRPSARIRSGSADQSAVRRLSPRALARVLTGDLDTIVLCAIRKEPERRYGSVGDLVEDVQRFRTGLPVRAQVDSLGYRTRKFVTRHRAAMAWGAAALVAAAIALPVLDGQRMRALREAARAEEIEALLGDVLKFALPDPHAALETPMPVQYVNHAARLVRAELDGQPRSRARLLAMLGRSYGSLGRYEASVAALDEALALQRADAGVTPAELAHTLESLGTSQHYLGRYDEAEAHVREALEVHRLELGEDAANATHVGLELADLLRTRGKLVEAERVLRPAVARLRAEARSPADDGIDDRLPRALRELGNVLRDRGALDESAHLYREAILEFRRLFGVPNEQLAATEVYFARLLVMRSELEEAEALLIALVPTLRLLHGGDHPLVGLALRELGYLRTEQGRFDEAGMRLDEAGRMLREWLGPEHPLLPRTDVHVAELARRRGRPSDAVAVAGETLAAFERVGMPDHPAAIDARLTLGEALVALGEREAAAREIERGLADAERQFVAGDARIARYRAALARARGT